MHDAVYCHRIFNELLITLLFSCCRGEELAFFSDIESGNEFMPRKKPITLVSEVVRKPQKSENIQRKLMLFFLPFFVGAQGKFLLREFGNLSRVLASKPYCYFRLWLPNDMLKV